MNTYANAFKTLALWALRRISMVALHDTTRSGATGAQADEHMTYQAMRVDAAPLRDASMETHGAVCVRTRDLSTRDGIEAELELMAASAQRRCGLSYELFVKLLSSDVDRLLDELEPDFKAVALEIAETLGYANPQQLEEMQDEIEKSGGCPLTGIDPSCCPCGRHE
ncbi:hypothetical protein LFL97_23980 [Burkholderia sp. JSH-S8]|nr:hypothetical protein LFL97_23980 [Burkholderia sp. JSH-S8]